MISFSSFAEWFRTAIDHNEDIHYIDFENIEHSNGLTYYWEMVNYTEPTDEHLSIAIYHVGDCKVNRYRDLIFNVYTQEMAAGEFETLTIPDDWIYPITGSLDEYIFGWVCKWVE